MKILFFVALFLVNHVSLAADWSKVKELISPAASINHEILSKEMVVAPLVESKSFLLEKDVKNTCQGKVLYRVYAKPAEDTSLGEDRLGSGTLSYGQVKAIDVTRGSCTYDIVAIFSDGKTLLGQINICDTWVAVGCSSIF